MDWHTRSVSAPKVYLDADTIAARVRELGAAITRDHQSHAVTFVVVLKGSFIFAADLVRVVGTESRVDFLSVRSYVGTNSSGAVEITRDLGASIEGEHVIVVEDIVDTGLTMHYLLDRLRAQRPASLSVAALLHKPSRARTTIPIDYLGFTIDDVFVVGYGLDVDERFRNLPYLGICEAAQ